MAQEDPDIKKFYHGVIGNPPQALVVQIPIEQYAVDGPDGLDMFYGKMRRIEAIGASMIKEIWARKQNGGLNIVSPGRPDLKVS